ncbi:phage tail sheath family protein [Vallitalea sp.]|jgi:hypothetical protein|uniref:phage tail sheath family protein n=1 Tax=Vallitalea sp. TaxID=1882829 RepID=UPI0025FC574D|nr:phage tail sheath family protein [Vallitalea sp.]MCT4686083.1 phage tail sheath family protein [Vallitalea sp.]
MAGGTWSNQNKVRPGVYINFESKNEVKRSISDRGIVTMPLALSFGSKKQVIEITSKTNLMELFGCTEVLLIKEALKSASKVLVYRVNGGTKASKKVGDLTITAKYEGVKGNDIKVSIVEDVDVSGKFYLTTFIDGNAVFGQIGTTIKSLKENPYVTFSGTGDIVKSSGIVLSGGSDSTATTQDYMDYFESISVQDFNTMALPIEDNTIKSATGAFIKRLRNDEGKKVQAVLADYHSADFEGIISVKNGVKLDDGSVIDKVKATAWVAGVTAGAAINESNTYKVYEGAIDVDTKYTNTQIVSALNDGEIVFIDNNGKIVIEQDINTLKTLAADKGSQFRKNRVIRCLDAIANDIKSIFSDYYIGKINNDADGRNLLKAEIIKYLESLQGIGAIQNFDAGSDITISAGIDIDAIIVNVKAQPVDSMEKLYMTVELN